MSSCRPQHRQHDKGDRIIQRVHEHSRGPLVSANILHRHGSRPRADLSGATKSPPQEVRQRAHQPRDNSGDVCAADQGRESLKGEAPEDDLHGDADGKRDRDACK